jgi:hypothetical protein
MKTMVTRKTLCVMVFASLVSVATPVLAHHSFVAEFDGRKTFVVTGVITKVVWTNPHILLWLDVMGDDGKLVHYSITSGPPSTLRNAGIEKRDFKVGETVTITGAPAKDGTPHGWLKMIKYADGRLFVYRDGSE